MTTALWLLGMQGVMGAFDTLYFHEWRARLPARGRLVRDELTLHALRSCIYAVLFATLPWMAWHGAWSAALAALIAAEIGITLADFVVEDRARRPLGGVYPGERVTHAAMGIVYGAMLAHLLPVVVAWWSEPTELVVARPDIPEPLRWVLGAMATGVLVSGVRDGLAARGVIWSAWPWHARETA